MDPDVSSPHALREIPAHLVGARPSDSSYDQSTVRYDNTVYPLGVFVRDINPDPANPYRGQSLISAAASVINSDQQMRDWNNSPIANDAAPGLILKIEEPLSEERYERCRAQFDNQRTGARPRENPSSRVTA